MENNINTNDKNENLVVYGIYRSQEAVEVALDVLMQYKFRTADVSVLFSSPDTNREFAHKNETKAPEGAMYGGSSGAVIGGTLGLLAGIGLIAIPGVGPFVAAGPIMSTLAGAGVGSTVGGVAGALIGLGFPEYEAKRYEGHINDGGILLSVHADNKEWQRKAQQVLKQTGAESISMSKEATADQKFEDTPRTHTYSL